MLKKLIKYIYRNTVKGNWRGRLGVHFKAKESLNYFQHPTAILNHKENVIIGENAYINEYVIIRSPLSKFILGHNSHIGPFSVIITHIYGVTIGDYVMIAPHCVIVEGSHEFRKLDVPMLLAGDFSKGPIIIEDDVWIGANCTILQNVRIGKGSIIGANSLVNKNVEPYSIMAGVPAKVIGSREKYKVNT
jgi:acetyltransferase-like isoleucine patch superfamily enzyme